MPLLVSIFLLALLFLTQHRTHGENLVGSTYGGNNSTGKYNVYDWFDQSVFNRSGILARGVPPPEVGAQPGMLWATDDTGPLVGMNFYPMHCRERDRVIYPAFVEAMYLAGAALAYMDGMLTKTNDGASYYRYFREESFDMVLDVYLSFFKPDDPGAITPNFNPLTISYETNENWPEDFPGLCVDSDVGAKVFDEWKGASGTPAKASGSPFSILVLCAKVFLKRNLPPWDLPVPGVWAECDRFKNGNNYAQRWMQSPGSVLFHEFMHYSWLYRWSPEEISTRDIIDYWAKNDPTNTLKDPQNGYAPWNCHRLEEVTHLIEDFDIHMPVFNADSHTYFALEAYWRRTCSFDNLEFVDPPKNDMTYTFFLEPEDPEPNGPAADPDEGGDESQQPA